MTILGDLVALAATLSKAKADESIAKTARIEAEEALIRATGFDKSEGQESFEQQNDGGYAKIVLKQPIMTKVDGDDWVKLRRTLGKAHPARGIFQAKYSLKTKEARALQTDHPGLWADISSVITRKPGKISVEIKEIAILHPEEAN